MAQAVVTDAMLYPTLSTQMECAEKQKLDKGRLGKFPKLFINPFLAYNAQCTNTHGLARFV